MPDWDANSPQLRRNLAKVLLQIRDEARNRSAPRLETVRRWHKTSMRGLAVPGPALVGKFRGERGLEDVEVRIGSHFGVAAVEVAAALASFEQTLKRVVVRLDELIPVGADLNADQLAAVVDLCAWVHAEWLRIHPFANGNGRTARLWANSLAMRYGLPPFVRLRPRPDDGYGAAGELAMSGDWSPTSILFRQMLNESIRRP